MLATLRERFERGERVDVETEILAHPRLANRLRGALATLQRLDRAFEAAPSEAASTAVAGAALGAYRLARRIGAGGMGEVWLASVERDVAGLHAGDRVAVKVLHTHRLGTDGFFKRFLREGDLGRRIRHRNVVATLDLDAVQTGERTVLYLAMEYVEGQTLRELIEDLGRAPEQLCRHIGREVARGLAAIHAAGAVHRDLKPENVIITAEQVVKVMDLGVAHVADEAMRLSQSGAFVGSLQYASPEQFRGEADARSDLHGLGLLLYELSTGQHPYAGDDFRTVMRRVVDERPRRPADVNPQLSPFFEDLVLRLLAKDPAARLASAAEVAQILEQGEESPWWTARAQAIRAETHRPLRRMRIPRETALYGREAELAKLRALYEKTKSGDGQVLLLEGEAGIGKSRLVDEFAGLLQQEGAGVQVLYGSYPPGGAATASGAFSAAYREHFGAEGLEDALLRCLTVTPLLVPAFAALLRGDLAPAGAEPLTKDSLQTCFVHATRALAADRPTIVLIDDLHFATDDGLALFASLALAVPGHRILLVGTTRSGLDEKWVAQLVRREQTTQLALPRLGPKELVHLLSDALRSQRLAEELAGLIGLKSDGNPFFVFELLRGLRDGQFLVQGPDGTWETTQIIRDIRVPSSIQELVQARVGDLDDEDRNLLDVAACCGYEFDPLLVGEVLGLTQIPVMQRFARIEKRHRLVRSVGRRYIFDHHQVQEALYEGMPELLREPYHASIAEALERRHDAASKEPKDLDGALCVELAEHFLRGAHDQRPLRYLRFGLDHLKISCLYERALRLAARALDAERVIAGQTRAEILVREASILAVVGRPVQQSAALQEALELAPLGSALRAEVLVGIANFEMKSGTLDRAEAALSAPEVRDRAVCASLEADITVHLAWGNLHCARGAFEEAREQFERAVAASQQMDDARATAIATGCIGNAFLVADRLMDGLVYLERALVLAQEAGMRVVESTIMTNLGLVHFNLGRCADAHRCFQSSRGRARSLGFREGEAVAVGNLAAVAAHLGQLAEARELWLLRIAMAREIADATGEASALSGLGSVLALLGRPAEARLHAEAAVAVARRFGSVHLEGDATHCLATLAQDDGETCAESLFTKAAEMRRPRGRARSLCARGRLRTRLGRIADGELDLEAALELARQHSVAPVEAVAEVCLAGMSGDDARAGAVLSRLEPRLGIQDLMEARFLRSRATSRADDLSVARRLLDNLIEHAPADCRESMVANVKLHREIIATAKEAGL